MRPSEERQLAVQRAIDATCLKLREADPSIDIRVLPDIPSVELMRILHGNCSWGDCDQTVAIFYSGAAGSVPKSRCNFHSRGSIRARSQRLQRDEAQRALCCPRPDKYAWGTYDGARAHLDHMRRINQPGADQLRVYECECGYYHIGHPRKSRRGRR